MRTILLLVAAGIVGSAITGIFTSYMTSSSNEETLAAFTRIHNADSGKLLPYVSKSIAACGSIIPASSPIFNRYAQVTALILAGTIELRATRNNAAAQAEQKALLVSQMQKSLQGVSDAEFRLIAEDLSTFIKDPKRQDCVVRTSLAELTKS